MEHFSVRPGLSTSRLRPCPSMLFIARSSLSWLAREHGAVPVRRLRRRCFPFRLPLHASLYFLATARAKLKLRTHTANTLAYFGSPAVGIPQNTLTERVINTNVLLRLRVRPCFGIQGNLRYLRLLSAIVTRPGSQQHERARQYRTLRIVTHPQSKPVPARACHRYIAVPERPPP